VRILAWVYRVAFVVARQVWLYQSPPTGGARYATTCADGVPAGTGGDLAADAAHVAREAVGRSEVVSSSKTA